MPEANPFHSEWKAKKISVHFIQHLKAGLYSFQILVSYFSLGSGCLAGRPGMAVGMSKWVVLCFGGHGFHTASSWTVRTAGVTAIGELPYENSILENLWTIESSSWSLSGVYQPSQINGNHSIPSCCDSKLELAMQYVISRTDLEHNNSQVGLSIRDSRYLLQVRAILNTLPWFTGEATEAEIARLYLCKGKSWVRTLKWL